jgi:hypothetical protein
LAIAFVVIDPIGFLGKGKTWTQLLPQLVGHSVHLVHILTTDEEDRRTAAWDSGTFAIEFLTCVYPKLKICETHLSHL